MALIRESLTHNDRGDKYQKLRITILNSSEWGSSKGELSTVSRELAKLSGVEIKVFVPQCIQEEGKIALERGKVKIVETIQLSSFEQLDSLCFPPENLQIGTIIFPPARWIEVVHTNPGKLAMLKRYSGLISKGEDKHKIGDLCEMTDHVVGHKSSKAYHSCLRSSKRNGNVFYFTPEVFEEFEAVEQVYSERKQRSVLVFGRIDVEDFELNGLDLSGKAISALQEHRVVFVEAPGGKKEEIEKQSTGCSVPARDSRMRGFVRDGKNLKCLFQEVDLVVMPSKTEGFDLTVLEALSAGLPVLVSHNSGFRETLCKVPYGTSLVIHPGDLSDWTIAIKEVYAKHRKAGLQEVDSLRDSYSKKYNWHEKAKDLINFIGKMISRADGAFTQPLDNLKWLTAEGIADYAVGAKSGAGDGKACLSSMAAFLVSQMSRDSVVFLPWSHCTVRWCDQLPRILLSSELLAGLQFYITAAGSDAYSLGIIRSNGFYLDLEALNISLGFKRSSKPFFSRIRGEPQIYFLSGDRLHDIPHCLRSPVFDKSITCLVVRLQCTRPLGVFRSAEDRDYKLFLSSASKISKSFLYFKTAYSFQTFWHSFERYLKHSPHAYLFTDKCSDHVSSKEKAATLFLKNPRDSPVFEPEEKLAVLTKFCCLKEPNAQSNARESLPDIVRVTFEQSPRHLYQYGSTGGGRDTERFPGLKCILFVSSDSLYSGLIDLIQLASCKQDSNVIGIPDVDLLQKNEKDGAAHLVSNLRDEIIVHVDEAFSLCDARCLLNHGIPTLIEKEVLNSNAVSPTAYAVCDSSILTKPRRCFSSTESLSAPLASLRLPTSSSKHNDGKSECYLFRKQTSTAESSISVEGRDDYGPNLKDNENDLEGRPYISSTQLFESPLKSAGESTCSYAKMPAIPSTHGRCRPNFQEGSTTRQYFLSFANTRNDQREHFHTLQSPTTERCDTETLNLTIDPNCEPQDIDGSYSEANVGIDCEVDEVQSNTWKGDLFLPQHQTEDFSDERDQSIPELSLASSEKTHTGTQTEECFGPILASFEDELVAAKNTCQELQQKVEQLEAQLALCDEKERTLQADLGRYLFLEDKGKRMSAMSTRGQNLLGHPVTRAAVTDYRGSCSFSKPTDFAPSSKRQGFPHHAKLLEIFNCLSAEEFDRITCLAMTRSKVSGLSVTQITDAFELFDVLKTSGELTCDSIGELLAEINRFDLVSQLGVGVHLPASERGADHSHKKSLSDSKFELQEHTANSAQTVPTEDKRSQEQTDIENRDWSTSSETTIPSPRNAERVQENDTLTQGESDCGHNENSLVQNSEMSEEVDEDVPVSSINAVSNIPSLQSNLKASDYPWTSNCCDGGVLPNCNQGATNSKISCQSNLNPPCSYEKTEELVSTGMDRREENVELVGPCANSNKEKVEGAVNFCNAAMLTVPSATSACAVSITGRPSSDATHSERLGARPKQIHRAVEAQRPSETLFSATDGLAANFLARHTQDKTLQDSLYWKTDARIPFYNNNGSHGASHIDGYAGESNRKTAYLEDWSVASGTYPHRKSESPALFSASLGVLKRDCIESYFSYDHFIGSTRDFPGPYDSYLEEGSFSRFRNHSLRSTSNATNSYSLQSDYFQNSHVPATNIQPEGMQNQSGLATSDPTNTTDHDCPTTAWASLVCPSGNASTFEDASVVEESACGTSILGPRNRDVHSQRSYMLNNREFDTDSVEPTDNSLLALERNVADACALVERVLREREEREQFGREIERKEQLIREQRAKERREREERELQEAESWPQQQEAINARSQWLCEHYQRHCRVRFPCCTKFYPCHRCHNISKACENEEAKACHATHLKCSHCQHEQEIGEDSAKCRKCGGKMSAYFCSICKHFTSVDKNPYHCEKCGICRIHQDKSFHCEVCNVCLDKRLEGKHKCRPDSGHDECCICLEDAFSGCQILPCSHKVHRECAIAMIQNGIRTCPICRHPLYSQPRE